jgi:hypothetical protein
MLQSDFQELKGDIKDVLTEFKQTLMQEISGAIKTSVTDAVRQEIAKVRKSFDAQWSAIDTRVQALENTREDIGCRIEDVEEKQTKFENETADQLASIINVHDQDTSRITDLQDEMTRQAEERDRQRERDISRNIVLRNVPETPRENVKDRVYEVLQKGLQLQKVEIVKAVRLKSFSDTATGVIIATCQTMGDKMAILKKKPELSKSKQYYKIMIHSDKPKSERIIDNKLRSINRTLKEHNLLPTDSRSTRLDSHSGKRDDRGLHSDFQRRPSNGMQAHGTSKVSPTQAAGNADRQWSKVGNRGRGGNNRNGGARSQQGRQ